MAITMGNRRALNIFISYAHEDRAIAIAVSNLLQHTFGESLGEVFVDTEGIRLGGGIKASIMTAIKRADVMIVVSTGVGRPSHDWTGWELGAFEATHGKSRLPGEIRGKVITICLGNTQPNPVQGMRYVPLGMDAHLLERPEQEFSRSLEITRSDELVMLLGDVLEATEGAKLNERKDLLDQFKKQIRAFKIQVFGELKKMIKAVRKPQYTLLVRYDSLRVDPAHQYLPLDATITEVGPATAFSLFGISDEEKARLKRKPGEAQRLPAGVSGTTLTWRDFKDLVAGHPHGEFWCASLARVVVSAGNQSLDTDNSQVIASHDLRQPRRFRVILTTSTTYFNGVVEASLYLVEALQEAYQGNADTTLLLKGLHIVCRFRFMFLEKDSDFYYLNLINWKTSDLQSKARQLVAELDLIANEAFQADLHKPGTWARYVSIPDLEAMITTWAPIEAQIRGLCSEIIQTPGQAGKLTSLRRRLGEELHRLQQKVSAHNSLLLKAMARKLAETAEDEKLAPRASPALVLRTAKHEAPKTKPSPPASNGDRARKHR